ncbi:MAG: DUF2752 domain-containing protein [Acidobacteria bacterium]|nr:DUF2752 domain-containing protein [Acidobacteriota bacterium]
MLDIHHNQKEDSIQTWRPGNERDSFFSTDRAAYPIVIIISGITIAISRFLEPASRGVGTHEQLGLPSCAFLHFTGIPCPGCGLTTSFAHAARLHIYQAFVTQPFGLLLFVILTLSIPLSIILMLRRLNLSQILIPGMIRIITWSLVVFGLISWVYKIIVMR